MQITFVSNYINHHQIPVSDRLYELCDGSYTFIQTEPMEAERVSMGWNPKSMERPYVKLYYEAKEDCDRLIMESDCVIFGGTEDESIILPRIEQGLFTVRYSESIYKEGRWKFISPRGLKKKYHDHVRFKDYPVYMLCSGAHVKGDFKLIHAYKGKMLKYGYFPKLEIYDDVHEIRRDNAVTEILWASRFIDWKHPEIMPSIATGLVNAGKSFHMTMIGSGELLEKTKADVTARGLNDYFTFEEKMSPEEVRTRMRKADIFVQTSDRKEGWGAVINEAMNSGCVTIGAKEIGAAPYLITSGRNGFLYKACHKEELIHHIMWAMENREDALKMGTEAYETIRDTWNADVAAERLYAFIKSRGATINDYEDGPLSRA